MTVGADRHQVFDGIDFMCSFLVSESFEVVNVHEAQAEFTVDNREVEAADEAGKSVLVHAGLTRRFTAENS